MVNYTMSYYKLKAIYCNKERTQPTQQKKNNSFFHHFSKLKLILFSTYRRSGNFRVIKFSRFKFRVKIFSWSRIPTKIF